MAAVASRPVAPNARGVTLSESPAARASVDERALLAALPIAAAVVGLNKHGILKLIDRNPRFDEVIALTGDTKMMEIGRAHV